MTIRARLTLWYAGILLLSVLVITGLSWHEFQRERRVAEESNGRYNEYDGWEDLTSFALIVGLPSTVIGLVGGWLLIRRAMAPVTALTAAAARASEGNLRQQLNRSGNGDEVDQLTQVFNEMTARLDDSFNRIREFTLHASHELKTPLTVMHGEIEMALHAAPPDAPIRERLASQLEEIRRLSEIVDGLTLLTKADAGLIALKHEPVRLDELVRESHADAQILARPWGLQVEVGRCEEVSLSGDRHRLRQMLLNLTDNAIKYNRPEGRVTMELVRRNGHAELRIANTGEGIPPEMAPRIFDRFFRGESSHNKVVEGCGLGLSIAQWIVVAHQGSITVNTNAEKITTALVRLPVNGN